MAHTTALSALDQVTVRVYVNVLFCFPLLSSDSQAAIRDHLYQSLSSFAASFPLAKGRIQSKPDRGYVEVINQEGDANPPFSTQSCAAISYDKLKESGFIIHGEEYRELVQVPGDHDNAVFAVKLTFVSGGCIMCISVHHSVVDAKGFESLSKLYAAHCSGRFSVVQESGWLHDRLDLLAGAGYEESLQRHGRIRLPEEAVENTNEKFQVREEKCPLIFEFSEGQIDALKKALSSYSNTYISSLDAVTAIICASIIRARSKLLAAKTKCSLNVAVDGRARLLPPLPDRYLGNVVVGAWMEFDIDQLISSEPSEMLPQVAHLASQIRKAIENVDDNLIRSYITMIEVEPDIRCVWSSGPSIVPPVSYMFSSWASLTLRSLDFAGEQGPCDLKTSDAVRVYTGGTEQLCMQPRVVMEDSAGRRSPVGPLQVSAILEKQCLDKLEDVKLFENWYTIRHSE
jgi:hypothetical protein